MSLGGSYNSRCVFQGSDLTDMLKIEVGDSETSYAVDFRDQSVVVSDREIDRLTYRQAAIHTNKMHRNIPLSGFPRQVSGN